MSFIKKIENFKNDDDILSDEINKRARILNNTSKFYNNLLDRYKDEYFEKYKQYNEEWKKSIIIRILMTSQMIRFLI